MSFSRAFLVVIIGLVLISSLVHHFGLYFTFNCFWLKYFAIQETHTNLINGHKKARIFILDQMRILISFIFLLIHYFGLIPMSKLIYMAGKFALFSWNSLWKCYRFSYFLNVYRKFGYDYLLCKWMGLSTS